MIGRPNLFNGRIPLVDFARCNKYYIIEFIGVRLAESGRRTIAP